MQDQIGKRYKVTRLSFRVGCTRCQATDIHQINDYAFAFALDRTRLTIHPLFHPEPSQIQIPGNMKKSSPERIGVVIPAAGTGSRMKSKTPKQFLMLSGIPILVHTIKAFINIREIETISLPVAEEHVDTSTRLLQKYISDKDLKKIIITKGGANRQLSVKAGIKALPTDIDIIMVHDGARPFISKETIINCIQATKKYGAAIVALKVNDTIKLASNSIITKTVDRKDLYRAQTPQGFRRHLMEKAWQIAEKSNFSGTDEASLLEKAGVPVMIVEGEEKNIKITVPTDLELADILWQQNKKQQVKGKMKIGYGFDAHRFVENRKLILGGEKIDYHLGLAGHSDADVLIHALIDAMLGAMGKGDIGQHFPDSNEKYKDIDSRLLLAQVIEMAGKAGYSIVNIDATIICQKPRLSHYLAKIRQNIAEVCCSSAEDINIKATTTEKMGYTGRGEGISCHAVILVEKMP